MPKFSKRSIDALKGVHPDLVLVIMSAICDSPIDFTVIQGVRTAATQKAYYAQGRTAKGAIITYADGVTKKSMHQLKPDGFGHAVDLYAFREGKIQFNDVASLLIIAAHIKAHAKRLGVRITWGGDWRKPYDPPHFQIETTK